MWNPGTSLSLWATLALAALISGGCAGKKDLYGHQVERVSTLSLQGEQWFSEGDYERACRNFSRALELSRAVDFPTGVAQQLNNLGAVALESGDLERARDLFTQAWILNQGQRSWTEASVNQANLATVAQKQGNLGEAEQHLLAAQEAAQNANSPTARGMVFCQWASLLLDQNRLAAAQDYLKRAQGLATTPALKGNLSHQWGRFYLTSGNTDEALAHFNRALAADRASLNRAAMAADLFFLGETQRLRGNLPQAWDYYSRAFDVYAALKKKPQEEKCRQRLQEVNRQGQLGRPLERFEKVTCPPLPDRL